MKVILPALAFLLVNVLAIAQTDEYPYPPLSALSKISQNVGNTLVDVEYERPSARKRKVFGELVPWNKVWRTGAGYCTKIRFDKPVIVEGQPVGPGYYSLFTIPNPETWTVILNRDTTLYGSSFYNADKDIARFTVMSNTTERYYETLTIDIDLIPNNARMYISWVNTQVAFDILTSTDEEMMRYIQDEVISGKSRDPNIYAGAAEYMLYQGINLHEAVRLADKALQLDKNSWAGNVKLKLYETMGYYEEAIQMVKQGLDVTRKGKYEREKDQLERIAELEAILNRLEKKQRQ
jgi:tetratricopeptide (TPR) repeat protein